MGKHLLAALLLSTLVLDAFADQSPFGIVHGPKAAFNIAAPEGWVIDNTAGADDGLPCVLYRKGDTWKNADPLMYAKIASTSYEDAEAFAKKAIGEMKKERGDYETKRVESGKTKTGQSYFINEYSPNEKYPRVERVGYVQLPAAVAYIVYSGDSEAAFRTHQPALKQLLESFSYLRVEGKQAK
ncbi:MAG: hypothetical protein ABI944_06485 [Chthoniobacterales bacterium]